MSEVHAWVGFAVVAVFAIGWLLAARRADRAARTGRAATGGGSPSRRSSRGLQALIGIVLLLLGRRPTEWLHYVYGFGPIVILVIAHALARDLQKTQPGAKPIQPWVPFAFASFICFGLTLRGLMTGLGIG